jgi:hypothetical protein
MSNGRWSFNRVKVKTRRNRLKFPERQTKASRFSFIDVPAFERHPKFKALKNRLVMQIRATCISFYMLLVLCVLGPAASGAQSIHTCTVIPTTESPAVQQYENLPAVVQKAVSYKPGQTYSNSWANGSTITVKFLGGSSNLQRRVMNYAQGWTRYANVNFRVVNSGQADIRVGFIQNGSSWSVVGNASARTDQQRPSMNFGWLTDGTPEYEVKRTVLHEFGHVLGLLHEHQNPAGGIPWDETAVYDHYRHTQGWDRNTTYKNVISTANRSATQYSAHDRASIMHYPVDARLTNGRYTVGMNKDLSSIDKQYIARMYPGRSITESAPPRPPAPVVVSTPTPAVRSYFVRISNELGKGQKAETVRLEIAGKRYTIRLDREGRSREQLKLNLPRGKHPYRVVTSSTYFGYRNVRDQSGNIRRRYVEREIPGSGSGYLMVEGDTSLALYGSYDQANRRMKIYLNTSK